MIPTAKPTAIIITTKGAGSVRATRCHRTIAISISNRKVSPKINAILPDWTCSSVIPCSLTWRGIRKFVVISDFSSGV